VKLRDLFVRIGFDVNSKPIKQLDDGIKGLLISIGSIAGAVSGAAISLFVLAKTTANTGERIKKMSQSLGISAEAFQELEHAASLSEVSTEEFQMAMRRLADSAMNASRGIKTDALAYTTLGISVTGVNGKLKASDQLFEEIANKLSLMPDGLEKTALANDLFGRSGAYLIPLLNEGSAGIAKLRREAHDLGIVMSAQDVAASDEFGDSITRLMAVIRGIKNQIGLGLMPVITKLVADMKTWIMANRELIRSTLNEWINRTIGLLKSLYSFAKSVVEEIKSLAEGFGGLGKVIKTVTTALMVFIGLKLVYSVGLMAQGIYGLAAAFTTMGTAAMWASLKAAALPLLIGGGIVMLLLLLEDLWRYSRGDKSVFGLLIEGIKKISPKIFEPIKNIIQDFKKGFEGLKDFFTGAFILDVDKIKKGLSETYQAFKDTVRDIFNTIIPSWMWPKFEKPNEGFIGASFGGLQNWLGNAHKLSAFTPSLSPVTTNTSTINSPHISVTAPIMVNVPPGTPQEEIGPRVQAGVNDAISTLLRQNYYQNPQEW